MWISEHLARLAGRFMSPGGKDGHLTILFYHRVLSSPDPLMPDVLWPESFEMQISTLARVFNVLPLDTAAENLFAGTLPERALAITFDDGYRDNLTVAVPVLKKYDLPATFFLTTGFLDGGLMYNDVVVESVRRMPSGSVDLEFLGLGKVTIDDPNSRISLIHRITAAVKYLSPDERDNACAKLSDLFSEPLPDDLMMSADDVRALSETGMAIGGHTVDHPILAKASAADAFEQIAANRTMLGDLTGKLPTIFAYPNGKPGKDYQAEHVRMVRDAGYDFAVSTATGAAIPTHDRYQLPRVSPWDFKQLPFVVHTLRIARTPADTASFTRLGQESANTDLVQS